jgi:oxygen-dependent protoporphyrinogen oxidase
MTRRSVAVVGGGISGLATAYRLRDRAHVTLIEAEDRLGGTIVTRRDGGFLIEGGPDSFLVQKPWALELCRELGLEGELIPTRHRRAFVYSRGRLHPLPEGMFLTVPTQVVPFALSGLLSLTGKLRMAMDLVLPRGGKGDESIGSFVGRRFGREAVEKIAEPIMAGIFVAPADRLSLRSTFPRLAELEREKRSLILALRDLPSSPTGPFRALRGGMATLVDVLRDRLGSVEVRTRSPARSVSRVGSRWRIGFDGGDVDADDLVLACPAPVGARLLASAAPGVAERIGRIPYVSTSTVTLGYRSPARRPPEGTGFVIPRRERRRILACTWSSEKFEGRAPEGALLVRCFFGGAGREAEAASSDPDLIRVAREELRDLMGVADEPDVAAVFRWPSTNPIYEVGHEARVAEIEAELARLPGLHLVGAGYRGVGIPDCVRDAGRAAERIRA